MMGEAGKTARTLLACALLTIAATPALAATLEGTRDDDVLVGKNGRDQINGRAGDDAISGRGGNDNLLMGGFFADNGDRGSDTLSGGDRDDSILGGLGPDTLSGGAGGDLIYDDYNEEGARRRMPPRTSSPAGRVTTP